MKFAATLTFTICVATLQTGCDPNQNQPESAVSSNKTTEKLEVDQSTKVAASEVPQPNPPLNGEDDNVIVTAGALSLGGEGLSLQERYNLLTGAQGYEGIGTNYSEVVVEGFKLRLGGISFGKGVMGSTSSNSSSTEVFNWSGNEKVVEIRDGFNASIEESAAVPAGEYDWLNVSWHKSYEIKAYAYFDRNYDGNADWTLYTSASGLQLVAGMLDMSTRSDYAYYTQPLPAGESMPYNGTLTIPSEKLVVKADEKLYVNLLIDSFRCVKAWDGRIGSGSGDAWSVNAPTVKDGSFNPNHAPTMGFPFNSAMVETNVNNPGKPFKIGIPALAITGIPMFTTASNKRQKIRSETYLSSWTQSNYTPYNTSNFIVLFNEGDDPEDETDDVPFIGAMNGGDGNEHLHVGSVVRHFSVNPNNTYNFYAGFTTGGGQSNPHPEWNDGGYYYNREITHAGHRGLDFPRLAVDASGIGKIGNATRCDDEYNYCVPDSNNVKSATNGATKDVYLKRVR
jgi:hypothetical protein